MLRGVSTRQKRCFSPSVPTLIGCFWEVGWSPIVLSPFALTTVAEKFDFQMQEHLQWLLMRRKCLRHSVDLFCLIFRSAPLACEIGDRLPPHLSIYLYVGHYIGPLYIGYLYTGFCT